MAFESVFANGGVIGTPLDFGSSKQYERTRPTLVGSQIYGRVGAVSSIAVTIALTGGTDALPRTGDVLVLAIAIGSTGTPSNLAVPTGYTVIYQGTSNGTNDTTLLVCYKVMGLTVDTTFTVPSSLSTANAQTAILFAWRNVDLTNPLDITAVSNVLTTSRLADPPEITPTTTNSVVIGVGAAAHIGGIINPTSTDLTGFRAAGADDTYDSSLGVGYYNWTSGPFKPAAFSIGTSAATDSSIGVTFALRGNETSGNYRNSGIWDLRSVSSYSYQNLNRTRSLENVTKNVALDIGAWQVAGGGNACTLTRDLTVTDSPFGGVPLKMAITGGDPYTLGWTSATWKITAATNGETWELRVLAKASVVGNLELFLFGSPSTGTPPVTAGTYSASGQLVTSTDWKEYKFRWTISYSGIRFLSMRLDGTQSVGSGQNIWFDGLQLYKVRP
jgi:hypothetical protein